jgi:uncharacterized protein (TIGR02246 family)
MTSIAPAEPRLPAHPNDATDTLEADLCAIRRLVEETYPQLANAGDADAYAALYTHDAVWSPPQAPDRYGPDQIRFAFVAKNARIQATMHVDDASVMGDRAFVTALARVHIYPKSGLRTVTDHYRGLWLMRREQGTWKIFRQIWTLKPVSEVARLFD